MKFSAFQLRAFCPAVNSEPSASWKLHLFGLCCFWSLLCRKKPPRDRLSMAEEDDDDNFPEEEETTNMADTPISLW
jgi:hypothetical protein